MIETDTLLVACPTCGTWPMAANLSKGSALASGIQFRCPKCHGVETGRLLRGQRPRQASTHPASAHR